MEQFLPYAPVILVVFVFFVQNNVFVKPEQLERKHREILDDTEKKFVSLAVFNEFKSKVDDMQEKISKIYDCIIQKDCDK